MLISNKIFYNTSNTECVQGASTLIIILWDSIAGTVTEEVNTSANKSHVRGFQVLQSPYTMFASITVIVTGNTSAVSVAEDGTLTCITSATGVTTGNYNNSFIEEGYTYYLVQIPSEKIY